MISRRRAREGEGYFATQERSGECAEVERRGAIRMNPPRLSRPREGRIWASPGGAMAPTRRFERHGCAGT